MYLYAHTHTRVYIHTYTHVYTHVHIHVYTHIHIYMYIHIFVYIHIYTCIYTYRCVYTHIHMYIYTHIYMYTFICIYTHIQAANFASENAFIFNSHYANQQSSGVDRRRWREMKPLSWWLGGGASRRRYHWVPLDHSPNICLPRNCSGNQHVHVILSSLKHWNFTLHTTVAPSDINLVPETQCPHLIVTSPPCPLHHLLLCSRTWQGCPWLPMDYLQVTYLAWRPQFPHFPWKMCLVVLAEPTLISWFNQSSICSWIFFFFFDVLTCLFSVSLQHCKLQPLCLILYCTQ
jgi:hypothetical protein